MFDVGFSELLLIGLVALLVFGPERLPGLVRETALWVRKIREVVSSARAEIESELRVAELHESLRQQRQTVEEEVNALRGKPPGQWLPRPPGLDEPAEDHDNEDKKNEDREKNRAD